jgi:DNA-binding SARP family transcriptional activator/predicted ATPase
MSESASFAPVLEVSLFGTLSLKKNGELLQLPSSKDARHLLIYLLLNRKKTHPRASLLGVFWAEETESRARKALSQAIWHIRRYLPELLNTDTLTLSISSEYPISIDIENFQKLTENHQATNSNLEEAIDLYRGDLLDGIYEEWALLEREYLHGVYLKTLEILIQKEIMDANYQKAIDLSQKLLEKDILRERTHREIMRLHYLLKRPKAALRQYKTCCELLEKELGVEPEAETKRLAEEIIRQSNEDIVPHLPQSTPKPQTIDFQREHPLSIALVGREDERVAILQHVENIFKGKGGMLLLEGAAGIGKTRLLQEIARDAEWRGAQILWGQTQDIETLPAFAFIMNALNEGLTTLRISQLTDLIEPLWLQVLSLFIPKLSAEDSGSTTVPLLNPEQEQARLAEAVTTFISTWGEITPLVLLLEDLHWADEDTLQLLPTLAERLREYAVLVVGTYRGEEMRTMPVKWEQLQRMDRSGLLERHKLRKLDTQSSGELIQRCLGLSESAPAFENRIYQETDGNPLFILETLRTLQDEGLLTQTKDGGWQTPWDEETVDYAELPLPVMVEQLIARRLEWLSDDSRRALNIAAILGAEVDFSFLSAVFEADTKNLLEACRDLVIRQLLLETPDGYRFSHDKIRQVTRKEMNTEERISLHQRVISILKEKSPKQIAALAYHAEQGELRDEAIEYYQEAAQQAENAHAYATALAHYEQAINLAEKEKFPEELYFDLLAGHENTASLLGKRTAQAEDIEKMQTLAGDDEEKLYQIALRKAKHQTQVSEYAASCEAAKQAFKLAQKLNDKGKECAALGALGSALSLQGQTEDSLPPLRDAIQLATEIGNTEQETQYRRALASALLGIRNYDEAKDELLDSLEMAKQGNNILEQAEIFNLLGIIYMERGESEKAQEVYEKSIEYCHQIGYLYGEARALINLGNLHYFQGRLDKTLKLYDQGINIFWRLGAKRGEVHVRLNRASITLNMFGTTEKVEEDALFAMKYAEEVDDPISKGQALTALAESQRQKGDLKTARKYQERGLNSIKESGDRWILAQEYRKLALLNILEKKPEPALKNLKNGISICDEIGLADLKPPMLAMRGLAYLQQDRHKEALQATSEAMSFLKPGIEQAHLLPYWHSQVLEKIGRIEEKQAAIQQAYEMLQKSLSGLPDDLRDTSLAQIPEHREIVAAWEESQPKLIRVTLEKINGGGEKIEITWTLATPEDTQIKKKVARRHHQLSRLLREAEEQGVVATHQNLADALNVGLRTIERDIASLGKQ